MTLQERGIVRGLTDMGAVFFERDQSGALVFDVQRGSEMDDAEKQATAKRASLATTGTDLVFRVRI